MNCLNLYAVFFLISIVSSELWPNDEYICPHQCICQYAHFMDLSIARWNLQSNRKFDKDFEEEAINDNEVIFESDESYLTNPLTKQATCILQYETNVKELFHKLPHDVQSLVILYTGDGQRKNITVSASDLKPLNQLITLEVRGPTDYQSFKFHIDEPLSFLQHANFESVQLFSSENLKRPKTPIHPIEDFDYVPDSEKIIYDISAINQNNYDDAKNIEILPYEIYIMEVKKSRMASFYGWENLEVLRIYNCKLEELNWQMFDGLDRLQHLSIEKNGIKTIPAFAFYGAMQIKTLSLAKNDIVDLHYRSLAGLLQLEVLDLSFNNLTKLSELSFPPFPKVELVDFRSNPIRYIFPATFGVMNNTREMMIGSNEMQLDLSNIGYIPFESLQLLRRLTITNLTITNLNRMIFQGLNNLEYLHLNGNIDFIEFDAFSGMEDLRELNLSSCNIREISMDSFLGCKHLQIIDLSHNQLKYIPPGLLDEQTELEEIYLNSNFLRFLPFDIFMQPSLKLIRLMENPWKCSCEMAGIWKPKLTNQYLERREKRCVHEFHSDKIITCHQIAKYKFDNKLSPRCDNVKGRSVYYALRKDLQCNFQKALKKNLTMRRTTEDNRLGSKYKHLNEKKARHRLITGRNEWKDVHLEKIKRSKEHINSISYLAENNNAEFYENDLLGEISNNNVFNNI